MKHIKIDLDNDACAVMREIYKLLKGHCYAIWTILNMLK